jgi:glyoxylase-like metal-dependent hydrolase (beta-lactamase superfamily II)/8-oxo-dGTP pyrophosphatase MutT (NUDIX family)
VRPGGAGEAAPRPAATVALLREGRDGPEVLLTHRPSTMAFGPGLHVFPGGAVEPGDARPDLVTRSALDPAACAAAWAGDLEPDAAVAVAVSAIRELFEESGVLLATRADGSEPDPAAVAAIRRSGEPFGDAVARLELVLRTDHLVAVSRWVTPPIGLARRYDARFFVAVLPAGAMVTTDDREVTAHAWLRPQAALEAMAGGRIELWPPTATTLQQLAPSRGLDDVRRHLAPLGPALPPELDVLGPALVRVRLHGAGGIPGATVNAYLVGRRRLVVVDPGDPNDAAVEAILAAAADRGATIAGVLLTAPVPDHAAGSTSVALRVGAPVLAAPGAVRVLSDGVEPLFDGRELDLADTPVRVLAAPGTHPDHLVFQLPEANALLTGDLDGRCARGIPEPMDERALATSRERIARLGPMVSHGAHAGTAD